jgi:hypothetical protein
MTNRTAAVGDLYSRTVGGESRVIEILAIDEADSKGNPESYITKTVYDDLKPERLGKEGTIKAKRLNGKSSEWTGVRRDANHDLEMNLTLWEARRTASGYYGSWEAFSKKYADRDIEERFTILGAWVTGLETRINNSTGTS